MALKNPRFPHWCRIYKIVGGDAWTEGKQEVVYEGECRRYNNDSLRNFYKETKAGRVADADYGVSIPVTEKPIKAGYLIDVTDKAESINGVLILDTYVGNLGTNIYINKPKN